MVEFHLSESPSTQIIYQVQGNVGDVFFVQDFLTTHKLSLYLECLVVVLTRSVVQHSFVTGANRPTVLREKHSFSLGSIWKTKQMV